MTLNPIAILVAVVATFLLGWLWYWLLSKPWIAAAGIRTDGPRKMPVGPMIVSIIALAIMATGLSGIIGHIGVWDVTAGIISGAGIWLAFVITAIATNNAYPGRPLALTLIDGGYWLAVLVLQGAILGAMGV